MGLLTYRLEALPVLVGSPRPAGVIEMRSMVGVEVKEVVAIEHHIGSEVCCRPALPMIAPVGDHVVVNRVAYGNMGTVPSGPAVLLDDSNPVSGQRIDFNAILIDLRVP